jgi:hypothetical protein
MPTAKTQVAVPGSARTALPGAKVVGDVDPHKSVSPSLSVCGRVLRV